MNTAELKRFAQQARRQLRDQVAARLEQVLGTDSAELRGQAAAIAQLRGQIAAASKPAVVDQIAYTWFNRFCALRFLDANRYQRIAVVSPAPGATQPEILQEAKAGYIEEELCRYLDRQQVADLLAGRTPSADPQQEAYRLLLVAACNALHPAMPFLFEPIADYTELLMPLDLLSEGSVLAGLRGALTDEACQDVEVIGWLYQFYIAERKDEVFAALKQNQKIEAEDIPAATQLFTPHWIVRYLVENSLGRLWLLNRPASKLAERMDYYIQPVEPESDFLQVASPEEIKVCDPACGSGHMLTYAFDLLYAIYEEAGYNPTEIPQLILEKNLYGIEIDARAGALAAFALAMKARAKDKRFFQRNIQPQICVLENICFTEQELKEYMQVVGRDLFSEPLRTTLQQFAQAKNFGSLIRPALADPSFIIQELERKGLGTNLLLFEVHQRVLQVLRQAEFLAPRYHVVVTNPPYMNGGNYNSELRIFIHANYEHVKYDLFSSFITRCSEFGLWKSTIAIMSPNVWLYISSYEKLRRFIVEEKVLNNLVELPLTAFKSATVQICAFTFSNKQSKNQKAHFIRLVNFKGDEEVMASLTKDAIINPECKYHFYLLTTPTFNEIPGFPIAYWINDRTRSIFKNATLLNYFVSGGRCKTHNDEQYLRQVWEVSAKDLGKKRNWCILYKGGPFLKFYGNRDTIIRWTDDAKKHYKSKGGLTDPKFWEQEGITWTFATSKGPNAFRIKANDGQYSSVSPTIILFPQSDISLFGFLGLLNTKPATYLIKIINPTLGLNVGDVLSLPIPNNVPWNRLQSNAQTIVEFSINDWILQETSWEFMQIPILVQGSDDGLLELAYKKMTNERIEVTRSIKLLEEENNRICIEAYGLQDELTPDVPLAEITLTCNPHYRYSGERSEEELEALLLADTMREFISYAVGCMFGRYSLDKPGLILANQGETLADYLRQVPQPTFSPDADNAIPILDGEWFTDDITERFKSFLRLTFGAENYAENLAFLEGAIGRDIRSYFLREFYPHHLKMYKNRPIYWLFSSPKGAFNCLIYMHRYTPDTVSVVLSRYLRELITKLEVRQRNLEQVGIRSASSQREKTAALKEIEKLGKTLAELKSYEREVLYPLAAQRIAIDLDDGVKVNYAKFGNALVKVKGIG